VGNETFAPLVSCPSRRFDRHVIDVCPTIDWQLTRGPNTIEPGWFFSFKRQMHILISNTYAIVPIDKLQDTKRNGGSLNKLTIAMSCPSWRASGESAGFCAPCVSAVKFRMCSMF